MRDLGLGALIALVLVDVTKASPYVVGTPGASWTEDQASIIKEKLSYIWDNPEAIVNDFDFKNTNSKTSSTDYLYDPNRMLSKVDCDLKENRCKKSWGKQRVADIAFTERKAIS